MKKIFFIPYLLLIVVCRPLHAQNLSDNINITSVKGACKSCKLQYQLSKIQFVSSTEGWAGGFLFPEGHGSGESTILHTIDGGYTWNQLKFVEQAGFESPPAFCFLNHNQGWIAWRSFDGEDHFKKLINNGNKWKDLKSPYPGIFKLKFFDDKVGYALSWSFKDGSSFLSTKDGGEAWIHKKLPIDNVSNWFFADSLTGWILGSTKVLKTVNGGTDWAEIDMTPKLSSCTVQDFFWSNSKNGWIVYFNNQGSYILHTTDGGEIWKQLSDNSFQGKGKFLRLVRFISDKTGFAFYVEGNGKGEKSYLLYTKDGGVNWQRYLMPQAPSCCQVFHGELWCISGLNLIKIRIRLPAVPEPRLSGYASGQCRSDNTGLGEEWAEFRGHLS